MLADELAQEMFNENLKTIQVECKLSKMDSLRFEDSFRIVAKKCTLNSIEKILNLAERISKVPNNYFKCTETNTFTDAVIEKEYWEDVKECAEKIKT